MTGQLLDYLESNGDKMVSEGAPIYDPIITRAGPTRPAPEPDMVNHPPHYNQGNIEVMEFIRDQKLGYCEGNIVKYVCRAPYKGNALEDMKKARFNLDVIIKELELEQTRRSGTITRATTRGINS